MYSLLNSWLDILGVIIAFALAAKLHAQSVLYAEKRRCKTQMIDLQSHFDKVKVFASNDKANSLHSAEWTNFSKVLANAVLILFSDQAFLERDLSNRESLVKRYDELMKNTGYPKEHKNYSILELARKYINPIFYDEWARKEEIVREGDYSIDKEQRLEMYADIVLLFGILGLVFDISANNVCRNPSELNWLVKLFSISSIVSGVVVISLFLMIDVSKCVMPQKAFNRVKAIMLIVMVLLLLFTTIFWTH